MHRILIRTLTTLALGSAFLLPSLGHAASASSIPTVTVTPTTFLHAFPAHLSAGAFALQLTTPGKQDGNSVNLARLNPGASEATISHLLSTGAVYPFISMVQLAGGVDSVGATTRTGLIDLSPGTYVVFSLDRLINHHNPGSPSTFVTVSGSGVTAPPAVATIKAIDFRFRGPSIFPAGLDNIKFTNAGKSPHEIYLLGIAPGKTKNDVTIALMQKNRILPSWARIVGGWGILSPGASMWMNVPLAPGKYVLLDFVPDNFSYPGHKATHKSHVMLGMIRIITVR